MQVPHEFPALTVHEGARAEGAPPAMSGQGAPRGKRGRLGAWTVAGDLPSSFRYAAQG